MAPRDYPALDNQHTLVPDLVGLALLVKQGLSPRVSTELLCFASADAHDQALQALHHCMFKEQVQMCEQTSASSDLNRSPR